MIQRPIFYVLAAALASATALAQSSRLVVPKSADVFNPSDPLNGGVLPSKDALDTPAPVDPNAEKKDKGPTEITSGEATFDQKAHIAIFLTNVEVKDPEFNVLCEKLTAHLKHEDARTGPNGAKAPPRAVAAGPKSKPGDPDSARKSGGGLESADAEMTTADGRVTITQDKKEADGTITHAIGHGSKAHYNALTGDIQLSGRPDVKKGTDWLVATDDKTVITLNRDGHMHADGPSKTVIIDKGDSGLK